MSKTQITQISKKRLHRLKKSKTTKQNLWVNIYTTRRETDVYLAKGLLENNGISCILESLPLREGTSLDIYRLKVLKSNLKKAKEILSRIR